MDHRYSLRFESGERRGETVTVTPGGFTVGRRPGNTLQILDGSVSGRHAELVVEDGGVTLRDTGSTNGTRVGADRVLETRLAHGDEVVFGNVRLVFLDAEIGGAAGPAAEAGATATAARGGEDVARVDAARLERARRSRKLSPVGLAAIVLLLAGGAAAWWFLGRGAAESGERGRPVVPVAGNLLADGYSFEDGAPGWLTAEEAPAELLPSAGGASGESALVADLAAGEWAESASPAVAAAPGRRLALRVAVAADAGTDARVGIELLSEGDAPGPRARAWSAAPADEEWGELAVETVVPPGFARARVLLWAHAPGAPGASRAGDAAASGEDGEDGEDAPPAPVVGAVAFDDVVLTSAVGGEARAARFQEFRLFPLGEPAREAVLAKLDRVLIHGLAVRAPDSGTATGATLAPRELEHGIAIDVAADADADVLALALAVAPELVAQGLATLGSSGFQPRALEFEDPSVESLLLGAGGDLVRLVFESPVALRGRAESGAGGAYRLSAELGAARTVTVQLGFQAERAEAIAIASRARTAEREGALGPAIVLWGELLDGFPFEQALVTEAERARGRLVQAGLAKVREVRGEVERARFFRLADLYRQCRDSALETAERYAGTEVEAEAREVARAVQDELAVLEVDLDRDERERLEAILAVLRAQEATGLAAEVERYLALNFAVGAAAAGDPDPSEGGR